MFEIARLLSNEALVVFAGVALTFVAALLSYRYIEIPFLRLKNRRGPNPGSEMRRNVADSSILTNLR